MYKRKGYNNDLDEVLIFPIVVVIGIGIAMLMVSLLIAIAENPKDIADQHNVTAAEFNALSLTERQIVFNFNSDLDIDEETYLMDFVEPEMTVGEWYIAYWQTVLALYALGFSILTFISYCKEKSNSYYLSDLPLSTVYGWVLFISMFAVWPILLLNWIYANIFSKLAAELREKRRERRERNRAERQKVQELGAEPIEELTLEQRFSSSARQTYVRYVKHGAKKAQTDRLQKATIQVDLLKDRLNELGQSIKGVQRELGEAKADLNQIQQAELTNETTTAQALSEWESLTRMRGVTSIKVNRSGRKTTGLSILVKVRVPYEGEFYDFGDYTIWLSGSEYRCTRTRSGIKLNATSSAPNYNETKGFCFGDRRYEINEYMQNGRFLEAVDLMVECLHSTNNSADEAQIPNCFRKVKVVERAQRRHQLYQRLFKGGDKK